MDKFTLIKDLFLFCRKIILQVLHFQPNSLSDANRVEQEVFRDLLDLLDEGDPLRVNFLDLEVSCREGMISTRLYRKPTAVTGFLDYRSFHPKHTREGVPTGQFLRARRNCTEDSDFKMEAKELTAKFKSRSNLAGVETENAEPFIQYQHGITG
ncbi:uncharacterized protein LOC143776632 [Ranitomeya variabilis]|uniref:uncharacterized protein LOC143773880 n=1 Tax=Ranitomeya variabilis TaxID=490064 RepID=UPI0040570482